MGHEASKTKQIMTDYEKSLLSGDGIDIGCGLDPIMPSAKPFDMEDGDANEISKYVTKQFDYVFSSHCLEHMLDPSLAIAEWWKLVKQGGHLIFTVPDEDLYEQGYFPSLFNDDHKSTFTISKRESWSDKSYNMVDLISALPNGELVKIELQDADYDRSLLFHSVYSRETAFKGINLIRKFSSLFKALGARDLVANCLSKLFRLPMDQSHNDALAQIFIIVKKI
jgi:SAM-dependent methyltransferase